MRVSPGIRKDEYYFHIKLNSKVTTFEASPQNIFSFRYNNQKPSLSFQYTSQWSSPIPWQNQLQACNPISFALYQY